MGTTLITGGVQITPVVAGIHTRCRGAISRGCGANLFTSINSALALWSNMHYHRPCLSRCRRRRWYYRRRRGVVLAVVVVVVGVGSSAVVPR